MGKRVMQLKIFLTPLESYAGMYTIGHQSGFRMTDLFT
jgi:hypothetical protein